MGERDKLTDSILEAQVDPEAWRLELERVTPQLKMQVLSGLTLTLTLTLTRTLTLTLTRTLTLTLTRTLTRTLTLTLT